MPHKNSESIGKSLHSNKLPHKEIEHKEIDPKDLKQALGRSHKSFDGENLALKLKDNMIDITAPETVEIQIRSDAKTIWINIDGICRLRACRIKNLVLIDEHSKRTIDYPTK